MNCAGIESATGGVYGWFHHSHPTFLSCLDAASNITGHLEGVTFDLFPHNVKVYSGKVNIATRAVTILGLREDKKMSKDKLYSMDHDMIMDLPCTCYWVSMHFNKDGDLTSKMTTSLAKSQNIFIPNQMIIA
eukprot:14271296-Ditylum_brightwellii.AAC.1